MSSRFIDPQRHIERGTDEAHGLLTARELEHRIDTANRIDAEFNRTQRFIAQETIDFFYPHMPANNPGLFMLTMFLTAGIAVSQTIVSPRMPQQCRLTALRLNSSNYVTAGTITPILRVYEPDGGAFTDYQFDECQINPDLDVYGNPRAGKSVFFDWASAIQIAKDESWIVMLATDALYAPTTNDYKALVTVSVDQWV